MSSSRRVSVSSESSGRSSPVLSGLDSTSALILVHTEDDEDSNNPFDFSDDEDDALDSTFEIGRPYIQPLTPSVVFLYLLSPYLKLGAMLLPNTDLPLKFSLPPLFLFAVLSAFARQIWYMLARYLRKADLEDIFLDVLARGRGKERRREVLRGMVRGSIGVLRVMLAVIYLRESVHHILPLLPETLGIVPTKLLLSVILALALLPFASAPFLSSKRVIFATWASIATYLLWLSCVSYAHATGTLQVSPGWIRMGALWQGITTIAFTFTSYSTLSLYSSLKAGTPPITTAKRSTSRSFKTLSIMSVAVAVALTLPLLFFAASPNVLLTQDAPGSRAESFITSLNAITLLLAIPSILVTTPSLPIPEKIRRSTAIPISRVIIFTIVLLLSIVPSNVAGVLSDVLLVCALSSTYFLPALVHITTHFLRRPVAIVMPLPSTPSLRTSPTQVPSHLPSLDSPLPSAQEDVLLQRKERALQRRQFRKRIIWDIGVWVLLLPVGGGGFVWGVGRVAGRW